MPHAGAPARLITIDGTTLALPAQGHQRQARPPGQGGHGQAPGHVHVPVAGHHVGKQRQHQPVAQPAMGPFEDASAPCHVIVVTRHVVQMHQRARLMPPGAPDAAPQGDVDHQQEQHGHDAPARPGMGMRQVAGQRHALKGHGHAHHQTQHGGHAAQAVHALPATMVDDPGPVLAGHDLPVACRQHGHRHQHGTGRTHQHAVPEIHRVDVVKRPGVQGRAQPVQPAGELRQQPGGQMKEVQHGADDTEPQVSECGKSGKTGLAQHGVWRRCRCRCFRVDAASATHGGCAPGTR